MKLTVDKSKCAGIGLCELTAPTVFEVGEDGQAHVLEEHPDGANLASAREAVANCPAGALSLTD